MNIEEILANAQGTIVDVRTPEEFQSGNAVGSVNIPVQEIVHSITIRAVRPALLHFRF